MRINWSIIFVPIIGILFWVIVWNYIPEAWCKSFTKLPICFPYFKIGFILVSSCIMGVLLIALSRNPKNIKFEDIDV